MNKFTEYANSFQKVARLRLESIEKLMSFLGNPQDALKFIHVAGTNGKGSVCAFLESILIDAGFKTGKYISPNLIRVNERISVNKKEISDADLEKVMEKVRAASDKTKEALGEAPTQFELWTAAAFLYFYEKKTDIVVLETGLGGERDATNIVKNTICSVITGIALDHTDYLGNSIVDIARAKAGIIKPGGVTVYMPSSSDADKVIREKVEKEKNRFIVPGACIIKGKDFASEIFDYDNMKNIKCGLSGVYQPKNASLAIETAKLLGIEERHIKSGIEKAKNPARFEVVSIKPLVIFDGAHNGNGVQALVDSLNRYFGGKKINFVTAVMADKDLKNEISILKEQGFAGSKFYTVMVENNPRAMSGEELSRLYVENGISATPCKSIKDALLKAKKDCDMVVVFGSLYLYKDYMEELN